MLKVILIFNNPTCSCRLMNFLCQNFIMINEYQSSPDLFSQLDHAPGWSLTLSGSPEEKGLGQCGWKEVDDGETD